MCLSPLRKENVYHIKEMLKVRTLNNRCSAFSHIKAAHEPNSTVISTGKAAPTAISRRKSSKEYFAAFKPISHSPKVQDAATGLAPPADTHDEPKQAKKATRRDCTLVLSSDSE